MWMWIISHRKTHKIRVLKSWWECEYYLCKLWTELPSYCSKWRAVYTSYSEAKNVNLSSLLIIDYEDTINLFFLSDTLLPFPFLVNKTIFAQIGREKYPRRLAHSSPLSVHGGCILIDLGMCAITFLFSNHCCLSRVDFNKQVNILLFRYLPTNSYLMG